MLKRTEETDGTSLRGEILTTRAELTAVLGEPMTYEEGTPTDHEAIAYHIGGHDEKAVILVETLVELGQKVAN